MQGNSTLPPMLALLDSARVDFTEIPNTLLDNQVGLGLLAVDLVMLLQVIRLTRIGAPIYIKDLVIRSGRSPSSVRRSLARLDRDGFLKRIYTVRNDGGGDANTYDVGPLLARIIDAPQNPISPSALSLLGRAIARYGAKCARCGSDEFLTADHIVPKSLGGTDDLDNIQVLCRLHNREKGTQIIDYRSLTTLAGSAQPA